MRMSNPNCSILNAVGVAIKRFQSELEPLERR
jgi:hypothetical protein